MEEKRINIKLSFVFPVFALLVLIFAYVPPMSADTRLQSDSILYKSYAASKSFIFNPRTHRFKAIKNGKVIRSGRASGGKGYCADVKRSCRTPSGTYRIISKRGKHCRSSRYPVGKGGAPMPYCMFFSKYYAVHGSHDVPNRNASHGCVRVRPSDARWLYHNFLSIGTKVIVKSY